MGSNAALCLARDASKVCVLGNKSKDFLHEVVKSSLLRSEPEDTGRKGNFPPDHNNQPRVKKKIPRYSFPPPFGISLHRRTQGLSDAVLLFFRIRDANSGT